MPAARRTPPPPPEQQASPPMDGGVDIPEPEKRQRSAKMAKLETAVSGVYMMVGGAATTLPTQIGGARVKMIGMNVASSSDEIAEAWIDLAEDDKRVLGVLESLTSFSGWGKVIGVHLMVVGGSLPGVAMPQMQAARPMQQQSQQPQNGGAMDLQTRMMMAELFRMAQSQSRVDSQPEYFEQAPPPQPRQPPRQQEQEQAPRLRRQQPQEVRPGRNAGIPSAADLGVQIADAPVDFPTSGSDNLNK